MYDLFTWVIFRESDSDSEPSPIRVKQKIEKTESKAEKLEKKVSIKYVLTKKKENTIKYYLSYLML